MIRFEVKFHDERVRRGLLFMERNRKALGKVFRKLRVPLREDLLEHARAEKGPDGAWPARASSTEDRARVSVHREKRKRKKGAVVSGPMHETRYSNTLGQLPAAVATGVRAGRSLIAHSKVPWSGVHNEGGVVGRGSRIPARPFVFFSGGFLERATDELGKFVHSGWRNA